MALVVWGSGNDREHEGRGREGAKGGRERVRERWRRRVRTG